MKLHHAALLAAALMAPAFAQAADSDPTPVDGASAPLHWILRPNIADISGVADNLASPEGTASVECELQNNGRASRCSVVDESPKGSRMGQAAVGVVAFYKAASKDSAGVPVAGRRVRFALAFGRSVVP